MPSRRWDVQRNTTGQIAAAGISMVILSYYYMFMDKLTHSHPDFMSGRFGDQHQYIRKAEHGVDISNCLSSGTPCRRVFIPTVVKTLPVDTQTGFMMVTFTSYVLAGTFLYLILQRWGFSKGDSLTGLLFFFTLGPAVKFNIFDFWLIDPGAFLFVAIVTWAILTDRDLLFIAGLMLGVTVKENLILLAPLYYSLNADELFNQKLLLKTIFYTIPALTIFLLIFFIPFLIDPGARLGKANSVDALQLAIQNPGFLSRFLAAFGIISVLPLFNIRGNLEPITRFGPFLTLVVAQFFYAPFAISRFMMIAYVPAIILAINGLSTITKDINTLLTTATIETWYWIPIPLFLIVITPFKGYSYMYIINLELQITLLVVCVIGLTILAIGYDLGRKRYSNASIQLRHFI